MKGSPPWHLGKVAVGYLLALVGTVVALFQWPFSWALNGLLSGLMIVFFGFALPWIGLAYYLLFRLFMGWGPPNAHQSVSLADLLPRRWRRRGKPVRHSSALWDRWMDGG